MEEQYLGEIRMFVGSYEPLGWRWCDGRSLMISQNEALFTIIGTQYGGDGISTFNLPNLNGRVPVGTDSTLRIGATGGSNQVVLTSQNMPPHTHSASGKVKVSGKDATTSAPKDAYWANTPNDAEYAPSPTDGATLAANAVTGTLAVAGSATPQPIDIRQPFQNIGFIIAVEGNYPVRN